MAPTVDSNTTSPPTTEIPPSPSSKQEPKRNKTNTMTGEKTNEKNTALPKNTDARLAGLQGGSRQAQ